MTQAPRPAAGMSDRANEARAELAPSGLVCGHRNFLDTVDDATGCGEPIETIVEVYRCTDCAIPFHRLCAERHFAVTSLVGGSGADREAERVL